MYAFQNQNAQNSTPTAKAVEAVEVLNIPAQAQRHELNEFYASSFRFVPAQKLLQMELYQANEHCQTLHDQNLKTIRSKGELQEQFQIESPTGLENVSIFRIKAELLGEYEHLSELYFFHTLFHPFEGQKHKFFLSIEEVKEEIQIQQNLLKMFIWVAGDENATLYDLINTIN